LDTGTVAVIPISAGSLSFVCHALRRLGLPPALRKISPCGRNDEGGVFSKWLKKGSSDLIVLV
jgi:hypothetical protein